MTDFATVRRLLDQAVGGRAVGVHGSFWNTMTRDEFVARDILGERILIVNDAAGSNLVRALRGLIPFGTDQGTAGASYRRMPGGRPAMPEADIRVIEDWINAGCPEGAGTGRATQTPPGTNANRQPQLRGALTVNARGTTTLNEAGHMAFWRDFDDWSLFNRSQAVNEAISKVFRANRLWMTAVMANQDTSRSHTAVVSSLRVLANAQKDTFARHFGNPLPLRTVFDSFEKFGASEFPADTLRPRDPAHDMNGAVMWLQWTGFCEGCIRSGIEADLWRGLLRCVLLGAYYDSIVRRRMRAPQAIARGDVRRVIEGIADADLIDAGQAFVRASGLVR